MAQKPNSSDRRRFKRPPRGPAQARLNARNDASDALWLFGLHAVRDALKNSRRVKKRLLVTPNAAQRLAEDIAAAGVKPEIQDPRKFGAPLDPQSVHQGAALESEPLDWGKIGDLCAPADPRDAPRVVLLDRVTDPHNVGAILRSAEVFGARAVIATNRHSSPETGALAKAASGALERQPYIRVGNLARGMEELQELGYVLIGLDGEAPIEIDQAAAAAGGAPLGIVLGAEGPGLRSKTRDTCDALARIPSAADFASLNVSNATAVALYATRAPAKD